MERENLLKKKKIKPECTKGKPLKIPTWMDAGKAMKTVYGFYFYVCLFKYQGKIISHIFQKEVHTTHFDPTVQECGN